MALLTASQADQLRQRRLPGDVHLRPGRRERDLHLRLLPARRRAADRRRRGAARTGSSCPTTAAPSSRPRTRSSRRTPTDCIDVYEFVDGRPQLITTGHRRRRTRRAAARSTRRCTTGLEGVSRDGVDVYFSTFDTLVPQDHNGALPQVLRRPHQRRLPVGRRPAALRRGRRVPRRRQLARRRRRRSAATATSARGGNVKPQKQEGKKKQEAHSKKQASARSRSERTRQGGRHDERATRQRPARLALASSRWPSRCVAPAALGAARPTLRRSPTSTLEPSTTQAGGHPDIDTRRRHSATATRRTAPDRPTATARTPKRSSSTCPTGLIGNPHATPELHAGRVQQPQLPGRTPRSAIVDLIASKRSSASSPSTTWSRTRTRPGLLGFIVAARSTRRSSSISARGPSSDYGLDATHRPASSTSSRSTTLDVHLWGVPGDAEPRRQPLARRRRARRLRRPRTRNHARARRTVQRARSALPREPDHLRRAARPRRVDVVSYDGGVDHADAPWPATTGCDQLSFNPSLDRPADDRPRPTPPSGLDVDLGAADAEPDAPSPSEITSDDGDPAARVHDQPQRGRRQDRLHRRRSAPSAPANAAQCPEYVEGRHR